MLKIEGTPVFLVFAVERKDAGVCDPIFRMEIGLELAVGVTTRGGCYLETANVSMFMRLPLLFV
jgi:hypothetical protein